MCHEPKNKKKVVHAPVQGGDCTSCHDPHQSQNKGMLKEAMPNLCFQCHQESMVKHSVVHPPVAAGDCSGCHDNHASDQPNRLVAPGNALCFTCHPDKEEGIKTQKTVHAPVKQSCVLCHSPHASPNKSMLTALVPTLCSNCHPNEAAMTQRAVTKHDPMNDQKACMNCHDPHFSGNPKLLPKAQVDLCIGCHDRELDTEKGRIMNMKAFLDANKNGHGPVKNANCTKCHDPHGSDYWRILARYYPSEFYTSYTEGKYGICFSCHDKSAFADLHTDKTKFRNGRTNLHFVHVNKNPKGRTCRACHDVHGDPGREHHVRDHVTFSGWSMPLNFSPSKTGGSCAPGCHGEKHYAR
jgi:predicted CXXCH cytochrome family protein